MNLEPNCQFIRSLQVADLGTGQR